MNSDRTFLSLHCHSSVGSIRDCSASIDEMVKICAKNNMSFTLTDHGWGAGIASYYKSALKHNIKPVFGIEFYLSRYRDRLFEIRKKLEELKNINPESKEQKANIDDEIRLLNYEFDEIKKYNHLIVLVKNRHGLSNLLSLHNQASLNGFYSKPLITLQELFALPRDKNNDRGLIVTSSCLSGVIPKDLLNDKYSYALEHSEMMKEEFGPDWYLEIQAHELEEQRLVNKGILQLSAESGVPVVIGTDSHYLSNNFSRSHEIFLLLQGEQKVADIGKKVLQVTYETPRGETRRKKINENDNLFYSVTVDKLKVGDRVHKKNGLVADTTKWDFEIKKISETNKVWMIESADLSFKNESQLREHALQYPELREIIETAIGNNKDIYDKIEHWKWDDDLKLPLYENSDNELFEKCLQALKDKSLDRNKIYVDRFKDEFKAIKNGGLTSYIILLLEIIETAKAKAIPMSPGRGSAAASLIFYLLDITRVDPIQWNFPFERFINDKKTATDSEKIRIELDDGRVIDLLPKEKIKLADGSEIEACKIIDGMELNL